MDFKKAYIYEIYTNCCNDRWIGSSTQPIEEILPRLWGNHEIYKCNKQHYCSAYEILKQEHYDVKKVFDAPCNNRKELYKLKNEYIKNTKCINLIRVKKPSNSYYQLNKEKINKKVREYRKNNPQEMKEKDRKNYQKYKEKIKKQKREYYKNNKELVRQRAKQWSLNNPDKIEKYKLKKKEKFNCPCGGVYMKKHKSGHLKSNIHFKYIFQFYPFM
jgi:hypothetical protein